MMKRLLLLALLIPVVAHASTYYVSGADGNDTNCTGLAQTPYVSGSAQPCPWKTVTKVNAFSFVAGDFILFKGGETFGQVRLAVSGSSVNPITVSSYNNKVSAPIFNTASSINLNGKSYLDFNGLYVRGDKAFFALGGEDHIKILNTVIENSSSQGFFLNAGSITNLVIDHCVFSHTKNRAIQLSGSSTATVTNTLFLSGSPGDSSTATVPWLIGTGSVLNLDYSLVQYYPSTVSMTNVIDGGHNIWTYPDPKIKSWPPTPKIAPILVLTVDDSSSTDSAYTFFTTVLEPAGARGTIFVNGALWTSAQAAKLVDLHNRGHEIANHSLNHEDFSATQAFVVTSTNSSPTINVDVASHTLTLSTTTPENTVSIDWTQASTYCPQCPMQTIGDLQSAVTGKGWTIAPSVQNSRTRSRTFLLDELADTSGAQGVPYTTLMDISAPNYKFYYDEWVLNKNAIQSLIGESPTTGAWPYGFNSTSSINWVRDNTASHNMLTVRTVGGAATDLVSVPRWVFIQRPFFWTTSDTEVAVRKYSRQIYFYCLTTPAYYLVYSHATTQDDWDRYAWFIDEWKKMGGQFMTYGQLAASINADHSTDGTTWTHAPYILTGADYHILTGSPAIGTGIGTSLATDITGTPYKTKPSIGAYEFTESVNALMYSIP